MSLDEKLEQKLRPHAERVEAGNPNDYDYLPAVLFSCIDLTKKLTQKTLIEFEVSKTLLQKNNLAILNKLEDEASEQKIINKEIIKQLRINQIITVLLSISIIVTIVFLKK
jgi:hypothetical protein